MVFSEHVADDGHTKDIPFRLVFFFKDPQEELFIFHVFCYRDWLGFPDSDLFLLEDHSPAGKTNSDQT